jgi:GntR family transcriptional regulator/MocR family aminotransferase
MGIILKKIIERYDISSQGVGGDDQNLYVRIYNLIREMIVKQDLPENNVLPPSRALAVGLGVSRSTIIRVYEFLRLEGFVESKPGSGHRIKPLQRRVERAAQNVEAKYPSISKLGSSFLSNSSLINSTDDKSVAFRPGLPPLDIFPVTQWKNLSNLYWKNIQLSNLSYSPSSGIDQLKSNIANYLNLSRDMKCDSSQVIIVAGSVQSLYLIGSSLLDEGDTVAMENPTFPNVHSIFTGLMADVHGVNIDGQGIKVDELRSKDLRPKLIHTTPSCHYPTGIKMSVERRKELLIYANENDSLIIENDYEHEINNWGEKTPTIFSLDEQDRTIYLGTFNRLLHPSLRIGYMVVPHYLQNVMEALLKHSHRFVPTSIQVVLNQFIEKKYLYAHIKKVAEVSKVRQLYFAAEFNQLFQGHGFSIEPSNTLSLQTLVNIPDGEQDKDLVYLFAKHNIITHSFSKCFTQSSSKQGLIMGHGSIHTPMIKSKLRRMMQIYTKQK